MEKEKTGKNSYLLPLAIVVSALIIAAAIVLSGKAGDLGDVFLALSGRGLGKESGVKETAPFDSLGDILGEGDDPVLGNPEAAVTMVIFGDFQCHFCKRMAMEITPLIVEKYVKSGQVKIVERDFAFLGKESVLAAEAANCAFEQDRYFEYAGLLHSVQAGHDATVFSKENLKSLSQKLDIDTFRFNQCLDSNKYTEEVQKDFEAGKKLGVSGTPTSFIGSEVIDGVQSFEVFERAIEAALLNN